MDALGRLGSAIVSSDCCRFDTILTFSFLASVYRVPLQTPTAMVCELRATALSLEPILTNTAIKHPLVCLLYLFIGHPLIKMFRPPHN